MIRRLLAALEPDDRSLLDGLVLQLEERGASIPEQEIAIAYAADLLVDWTEHVPPPIGQLLEAVDGPLYLLLLRLFGRGIRRRLRGQTRAEARAERRAERLDEHLVAEPPERESGEVRR